MLKSSLLRAATVGLCLVMLAGCAEMDEQEQRMMSGGVGGAVVGTVVVAITGGCIPCGTVIGGAVGTAGGYVVDQIDKYNNKGSSPSPSNGSSSNNYNNSSSYNSSSGSGYYNSNPPPSYN